MTKPIIKKICPAGLKNNPNRNLKSIDYITIHNTGNYTASATAASHANFLLNGSGGSQTSWHYTVDKDSIYQHFEDASECWHAGDGNNGTGNYTSIGIEICVNDKAGFALACTNAAELAAELLLKYNLPIDRVVQHNKWSGKNCPTEIRSGSWGVTWNGFIEKIKSALSESSLTNAKSTVTPIIGQATATVEQARQWARNKAATGIFISLADLYWNNCESHGKVNPVAAYCQAAKETAFGKFGGVLNESYCNPCGMKITAGGGDYDASAHTCFMVWGDGIRAHLDHLSLYAGALGYPKEITDDPRHFPYLIGTAKTVEALGCKWAPSATYGEEIVKMMRDLEVTATVANDEPKSITNSDETGAAISPEAESAIKTLVLFKVMVDPEYWRKAVKSKAIEYLEPLIINMANALNS